MVNERGSIWKQTGWYITPRNAREVMSVVGAVGVHSIGQRFAWRGMSSADYRVTSSIHRRLGVDLDERSIREAELRLLTQARTWGLGIGESGYVDDLELLANLQHYGIETRLLDFTSNPMTALWFACQAPSSNAVSPSGVLLALNVSDWPTHTSASSRATTAHMDSPHGATLSMALNSNVPFLVESSRPNDRLRAQEGFFVASAVPTTSTFRRSLLTPFWSIGVQFSTGDPDDLRNRLTAERVRGAPKRIPFVAVIIKPNIKRKLLTYLENTFNRSAGVLFPDYAGFREFAAHGGRGGEPGDVSGSAS